MGNVFTRRVLMVSSASTPIVSLYVRQDRFSAMANVCAPLERRKHPVAIIAREYASLVVAPTSPIYLGLGKFWKGTNASVHLDKFWKGANVSVPLEQNFLIKPGFARRLGLRLANLPHLLEALQAVHPEYSPVSQLRAESARLHSVDDSIGKCYTFTFGNGHLFGYNSTSGFYTASPDHQFSKFQVCADQCCSPSPSKDIPTGTYFNLQEIFGPAPPTSSQRSRIFVSNATEGAYMTRTSDFSKSGGFIITKWPGGKHCLGGYQSGVGIGLTAQAGSVGATTLPSDEQSCILITLTEVPCDIRARDANCIGENKTETPASPAGGKGSLNASMPNC
jgi:hypothetical protein